MRDQVILTYVCMYNGLYSLPPTRRVTYGTGNPKLFQVPQSFKLLSLLLNLYIYKKLFHSARLFKPTLFSIFSFRFRLEFQFQFKRTCGLSDEDALHV